MAAGDGWDAEKMLDLCLRDYLVKKNMHETDALFRKEASISNHSVVTESPHGFLQEWWSLFYYVYASRQPALQEYSGAEPSTKAENLEDQSQNFGPLVLQRSMINQQRPRQVPVTIGFDSSLQVLETNQLRHPNLYAGNSSLLQQQINLALHQVKREQNQGISLGRDIPINRTTPCGAQRGKLPVTWPHAAG